MKKMKAGLLGIILFGSIVLSACGVHTISRADDALSTAKDAAEHTMESLKALDLERFNEYTDNYVDTYHNWIGVPIETEYRVLTSFYSRE